MGSAVLPFIFFSESQTNPLAFRLVCDMLILGLTLHRAWTYHRSVGLGSASLLRTMSRDGERPCSPSIS
jgi:hypothetical protein